MDRRRAIRILLATGAGPLLAFPSNLRVLTVQDSTFRSDVFLVLLDVSVKDAEGRFVSGLGRANFSILENGRPQTIAVFDPADRPVTLGILMDESRSMMPNRLDAVEAARALVRESNRLDEVFVLHFNETVAAGLPAGLDFSSDPDILMAAVARGVPGGKTALYDSLYDGLTQLRLGRRDRKALVLISDGGDTASRRRRREVLDLIDRSPATVYAIGLFDPSDPDRDPGFLRRLAKVSGGEAYLASKPEELPDLCRRIARDIRARYTLGYIPSSRRRTDGFVRVDVQVSDNRHRRLTARTRSGYRFD